MDSEVAIFLLLFLLLGIVCTIAICFVEFKFCFENYLNKRLCRDSHWVLETQGLICNCSDAPEPAGVPAQVALAPLAPEEEDLERSMNEEHQVDVCHCECQESCWAQRIQNQFIFEKELDGKTQYGDFV